ncbi:MAG: FCD domain-containing protein [Deltaproteobacteria bacterium]|nr:FCD domain-containing protein [Deltaproteobacteria bacterium]
MLDFDKKLLTAVSPRGRSSPRPIYQENSEINLQFHIYIWNWCGNPSLTKILNHLSSQLNRFIITALHLPHRMERSVKEHRKIVEGFKTGNAKLVEKALSIHFKRASEDLKKEITKKTD